MMANTEEKVSKDEKSGAEQKTEEEPKELCGKAEERAQLSDEKVMEEEKPNEKSELFEKTEEKSELFREAREGKIEKIDELKEEKGELEVDRKAEKQEGGAVESEGEAGKGEKAGKLERKAEELEEEKGDGEEEGESEEESEEKREAITPSSDRPARKRKMVERYSDPATPRSSVTKGLSIEKGHGTQLKDIPNVAFKLSKRKADDSLQMFHTLLFGKKAKVHVLKRNIGQFSGYVWAENEQKQRAKVKEKLDKCVKEKLIDFCDVLDIPINKSAVKKEELCTKLLEFLELPHATSDILLAEKEKVTKSKKKLTPGKSIGSGEVSIEAPSKKQKQASHSGNKRKQPSKTEGNAVDQKDNSSDFEEDSDENGDKEAAMDVDTESEGNKTEEVEDEPENQITSPKSSSKKKATPKSGGKSVLAKKETPAVSKSSVKSVEKSSSTRKGASVAGKPSASISKSKESASRKQKVGKERSKDKAIYSSENPKNKKHPRQSSLKDSTKGKAKTTKKAKSEPTREEMHVAIEDILKDVDFNTATLSDILKQLVDRFGVDLMHRKSEIKDIIADVINNMTDEEEDEEAENSVSDDADKDGDGADD